MPKVDKATEIKKEAAKVNKKVAADKNKAAKEQAVAAEVTKEEAKAAAAPKPQGGKAPKTVPAKGAFATAARMDNESDDEAVQQEPTARENGPSTSEMPSKSKKTEKLAERKKQQQAGRKGEFSFLEEEERSARKKRIIDRFLRMLVIGFFLEAREGTNGQASGAKAPKKKPTSRGSEKKNWDFATMREKASEFSGPLLMLLTMILLMGARLSEENYTPTREDQENHYEVLGLARDADVMDIRKAYKALALSWHPDKNPDCEACAERFARISKSYETLSNPERKKAYDNQRAPENSLNFANTVELTAENFEHTVLRSNEVWIVQVYEAKEEACRSFHPIWEEATLHHGNTFRFGRIDISKSKKALDFLPQKRVVLMPVVWRFMRGREPEQIIALGSEDHGQSSLSRFLGTTYTEAKRISKVAELKKWWAESGNAVIPVPKDLSAPRFLLVSPNPPGATLRGQQRDLYLKVQRIFHQWGEFAEFVITDKATAKGAISAYSEPRGNGVWTVLVDSGNATLEHKVAVAKQGVEDVPAILEEHLAQAAIERLPLLTVRNYQQLCGAQGRAGRTYCLLLVNQDEAGGGMAKKLAELASSRAAYAQELQELAASDGDEAVGEAVHIQPVRLTTRTSRSPWSPPAVGPAFSTLWAEAKRAPVFLLELETRRIAIVKSSTLNELYAQVAYDDLKFNELPETLSLSRAMPDPEITLRREIIGSLTTGVGAVVSFLFVAGASAVAPEMSPLTGGISAGASLALIIAAWPALCRRFLGVLIGGAVPFPF